MKSLSLVAFLAALSDAFTFFPRRAAARRKESERALDDEWRGYFVSQGMTPDGELAAAVRRGSLSPYPPVYR